MYYLPNLIIIAIVVLAYINDFHISFSLQTLT